MIYVALTFWAGYGHLLLPRLILSKVVHGTPKRYLSQCARTGSLEDVGYYTTAVEETFVQRVPLLYFIMYFNAFFRSFFTATNKY